MSKHKNYPMRVPRPAGGIRLQETRATSSLRVWWAKRYQARLESMGLLARMGRGRNYALSGQVVSLAFVGPHVEARVVGVRPEPYRVTIDFRVPSPAAHQRIVARLKAEPMLVARLLANDLPLEVEEIFADEEMDFFPGGKLAEGVYDMTTACSCPDYANPCKHVVAVLLLLGEEIARRPLTLLELRGISTDELCEGEVAR